MRTLTAIVLLAAVLGGCGAKTPNKANDYALAVSRAQFLFADDFENATSQLESSTNPATDARALRNAADAVTRDVKTLRTITPPKEVRGLHLRLINLIAGYGATVRHAATLVAGGNPQAFVRAKRLLTQSSDTIDARFNSVINKMNQTLR